MIYSSRFRNSKVPFTCCCGSVFGLERPSPSPRPDRVGCRALRFRRTGPRTHLVSLREEKPRGLHQAQEAWGREPATRRGGASDTLETARPVWAPSTFRVGARRGSKSLLRIWLGHWAWKIPEPATQETSPFGLQLPSQGL